MACGHFCSTFRNRSSPLAAMIAWGCSFVTLRMPSTAWSMPLMADDSSNARGVSDTSTGSITTTLGTVSRTA
ncbi:hypothetical protein D3C85_782440 [compost metagenome]